MASVSDRCQVRDEVLLRCGGHAAAPPSRSRACAPAANPITAASARFSPLARAFAGLRPMKKVAGFARESLMILSDRIQW